MKTGLTTLLTAVLLLTGISGYAAQSDTGNASVFGPWLKVSNSVRSTGMGEAYAAVASGADGMQANPAALAYLNQQQLELAHNAWFQDSSYEHAAYGLPLGGGTGLGVSFDYLILGNIDKFGIDPNTSLPVPQGSFAPTAMHGDVAYGQQLGDLAAGVLVKFLNQNIDGSSASGLGLDLGGNWKVGSGLSLAAAAQNIGAQVNGAKLHLNVKVGTAFGGDFTWKGDTEKNSLVLAADANLASADQTASTYSVGGEFWFRQSIAVRGGYKFAEQGGISGVTGLTFGLGYRMASAEINYATLTKGDLGQSQQASLLFNF